jgi:hypothetical protein
MMEAARTSETLVNFYQITLLIALMMEAARTSETLVNFYQTTRSYNTEDSHLCLKMFEYDHMFSLRSSTVMMIRIGNQSRRLKHLDLFDDHK